MATAKAKKAVLTKAAGKFDEAKRARVPAGQTGGGRFTSVSVSASSRGALSIIHATGQTKLTGALAKEWGDHLAQTYGLKGADIIKINDDDLEQIQAKQSPKGSAISPPKEAKVDPPPKAAPREAKVKPSTVSAPKEGETPVVSKQAIVQKAAIAAKKKAEEAARVAEEERTVKEKAKKVADAASQEKLKKAEAAKPIEGTLAEPQTPKKIDDGKTRYTTTVQEHQGELHLYKGSDQSEKIGILAIREGEALKAKYGLKHLNNVTIDLDAEDLATQFDEEDLEMSFGSTQKKPSSSIGQQKGQVYESRRSFETRACRERGISEPEEFTSAAEAENWLSSHAKNTIFDFEGVDPKLLRGTAAEYAALVSDFPEVAAQIKGVGTGNNANDKQLYKTHLGGMASGTADPRKGNLKIKADSFDDAEHLYLAKGTERVEQSQGRKGFTVLADFDDNELSNTVVHEFGHFVDFHLQKLAFGKVNPNPNLMRYDEMPVKNKLVAMTYLSLQKSITPQAAEEISIYAKASEDETFAEGFLASRRKEKNNQPLYSDRQAKAIDLMMKISRDENLSEAEVRSELRKLGINVFEVE